MLLLQYNTSYISYHGPDTPDTRQQPFPHHQPDQDTSTCIVWFWWQFLGISGRDAAVSQAEENWFGNTEQCTPVCGVNYKLGSTRTQVADIYSGIEEKYIQQYLSTDCEQDCSQAMS